MSKIAIVEDDPAIAQMYRIKFEAEGYQVETADNGRSGFDMLQRFKPDIALMDLMMPEMDGIELLKILRQQDWGRELKVIILTNAGEVQTPDQLQALGVSEVIVKADKTPRQVAALVREELAA